MVIKIAEYKIKQGELPAARAAVQAFTHAVRTNEPDTLYEAYQKDQSREFIHLMKFPDEHAEKQHKNAPYTHAFVEDLYPRCEIEPHFTNIHPL